MKLKQKLDYAKRELEHAKESFGDAYTYWQKAERINIKLKETIAAQAVVIEQITTNREKIISLAIEHGSNRAFDHAEQLETFYNAVRREALEDCIAAIREMPNELN